MTKPYPLKFVPEFKERVWGGRNLERFGFAVPPGVIGEAWTIADHANGTSRISNGPLEGQGLDEVRAQLGAEWLGERFVQSGTERFPLLIKLLDCEDDLSVQVHPGNDYEKLPKGELGKTEMWYVLDAKPGAKIIYGLKEGMTREAFAEAIEQGRIMETLQEVPVSVGDSFYIPAGTVHALCAGVLVAEIQQNSDTTYRVYDYNRPGLDGKPRELHIEDSLNVTSYTNAGASRMTTELAGPRQWLTLAQSPYFVTDKGRVEGEWPIETDASTFQIVIVCEGSGAIGWADGSLQLQAGDCVLVPANLDAGYTLSSAAAGGMTVLRSRLP